jgi:histidyl-tRNA synthetase
MFGSESPAADATAIALAASVLRRLGLTNVTLHLNSIGCKNCRPNYRAALVEHFGGKKECLCDTCKSRLDKNPLRLLDCKNPDCAKIAADAPRTVDHLCDDCASKFNMLCKALDAMKIDYVIDPSIVRGLDYYTGAVFEFIAEGIGAQSTVCGGGRYDGLVESLGGPALSGIGFGMGITRLILAMKELGIADVEIPTPDLYIAALGERATVEALAITERLRGEGRYVECDIVGRSLKAQMKYADKLSAKFSIVIGDDEIAQNKGNLKNMTNGETVETELSADSLIEKIKG